MNKRILVGILLVLALTLAMVSTVSAQSGSATVTIKVGDHHGGVHEGYRVHVYKSTGGGGGEWAWQDSDANGLTAFSMADGSYSYKVEKNGIWSSAYDFTVADSNDLNLEYKLSKVVIKVGDHEGGVHKGYRVHIYKSTDGGGGEWAWQDSDDSGLTTFWMVDGSYSYKVEKNGAWSAPEDFDVVYSNDYDLEYKLSKVVIKVGDHEGGVHKGYRVHVYKSTGGAGGEWAWQDSDDSGLTTFWMVDGSYSYKVEKNGAWSAPEDFDVVYSNDYNLEYKLSKVVIKVGDHEGGVHQGYRVHVYKSTGGGGGEWAWQDSDANGLTTFWMVDGSYSYKVEKNGAWSAPEDFDVVYSNDYDLEYKLSKVVIKVGDHEGGVHKGYRVHVYKSTGGAGGEWAWQDSDDSGLTTFWMVDGFYSYKVEKNGAWSAPEDFDVVYSNDYDLEYKLSKVTIKVTDKAGKALKGYRVHVYKSTGGAGGEWAWQDSDDSGLTTFYMVDGSYSYKVEKGCYWSTATDFTVNYSNDLPLAHKATVIITIKVGDHYNGSHDGYLVRVYKAGGGEIANAWSAGGGLTAFEIDAPANYEYRVEKSGAASPKIAFQACTSQTIEYKLSKLVVKVGDHYGGGHQGYLVRVYNAGAGEWGNAWSDASGETTFWLIEGGYEYRVEKSGAVGPKLAFTVEYCQDQALEYKLSRVVIKVGDHFDGGHQSYLVRVFNAGAGEWGNAWSDASGETTFWLIEGGYEYRVEKSGAVGPKLAFTVEYCQDQALEYKLSKVVIKVGDHHGGGHQGYLVRVFNAGAGEWGNAWSDASGETTFWLIEGGYEYRVEKSGAVGPKLAFTVEYCQDQALEYKLSKVVIKVGDHFDGGHQSYLVRVFNAGAGEWGNAWSDASGETTFWLIEGGYEYRVEKSGAVGPKLAFTVEYCQDQALEYKLSRVVIKVTDKKGQGLQSFLVRVYNAGAGEWGNQWSNASGETTFWLIEGGYEYKVEKNCYNSGKVPFTVVYSNDYNLVQKATVVITIKVSDHQDIAHKGYLVRVYQAGGSQIAYQWSNDSGLTNFELDALTNYEYLVEKNGARSPKKPFATCVDATLEYKLSKMTIKVSDHQDGTHKGYLVRVYNGTDGSGSQWGYQWSDVSGMTTFYLVEGDYGYLVEKNGARSAKKGFTVVYCTDQDLVYQLSKITIKVSDHQDSAHQGYLVRVYNGTGGSGSQWGYQWSNAEGMTTFYLVEGDYGYLVEKNGAQSKKVGFTVEYCQDQDLVYELAKVTVKVSDHQDGAHKGYLVRVYNGVDGSGSQWGYQWSDAEGMTTFYLVEGDYGYLVEKNGAQSDKVGFIVEYCQDAALVYQLSKVTIKVSDHQDGAHQGYLVRVYNGTDGSGSQWGYQWSDVSGMTTFYLVEGDYGYLVEKNGARSQKVGFTAVYCTDQDLVHKLSKITVKVSDHQDGVHKGYLVRVYNGVDGSGSQWGYQWSDAEGMTTFYLVEGDYGYLVEKNGARSAKKSFTVVYCTDQDLVHELSKITIKVSDYQDGAHQGYLVRVYNGVDGSGSQWGYQWSDANGMTTFYLVEGNYGYLVEKNGAKSTKNGFIVVYCTDQDLVYKLSKVTLRFSGAIKYYVSGWKTFTKPSMYMFPGTYPFSFSDGSRPSVQTDITVPSGDIEKTVAYLQVKDHNGAGMAGGTARGGYTTPTAWHVSGQTDADGVLLDVRDGLPTQLSYEMKINNTVSWQGPQDPSANSFFDFQTILLTLRLETCDGTPLDGGNPRYGHGSTYTTSWFPGGATGSSAPGETEAEFFPGTYSFEMQYQSTAARKLNQVIPNANTKLTWQTTKVTLHYSGQISYGGGSGDSSWFTKPSMELLEGTYKFHFRSGDRTDLTFSGCNYEKTMAALKVVQSDGVTGQAGVTFVWQIHGQPPDKPVPGATNSEGVLLHIMDGYNNSKTRYLPTYLGGVGPRMDPTPATESFVNWQLINVTVELRDVDNNIITDATPLVTFEYPGGGRQTFGNLVAGQLSKEMMPTSGYCAFFIDDYNKTSQRKDASPMNTSPYVHTFQTGKIVDNGYQVAYFRIYGGQDNDDLGPPYPDEILVLPHSQFYFYHATRPRLGPIAIGAGQTLTLNSDGTYSISP